MPFFPENIPHSLKHNIPVHTNKTEYKQQMICEVSAQPYILYLFILVQFVLRLWLSVGQYPDPRIQFPSVPAQALKRPDARFASVSGPFYNTTHKWTGLKASTHRLATVCTIYVNLLNTPERSLPCWNNSILVQILPFIVLWVIVFYFCTGICI